ncbi:MAG TPA: hypothetical protein VND19_25065 [Acetobacteraceae bacterium]|nr:hypothetical protein [Acetobacteraceae bacterium]
MAANEKFFADPNSRKVALGLQTGAKEIWLNPTGSETYAFQNGGVLHPKRHDIEPGKAIFSFTSVTSELKWMIGRDWWVERRELDQIIRFSQVNDVSIGRAVRVLCCAPFEWGNKLNFLIAARTKVTLAAWRGLANSAAASADLVSPTGRVIGRAGSETPARNDIAAWRCWQLYIPGLKALGADATAWLSLDGQYQLGDAATWLYT